MTSSGRRWAFLFGLVVAFALPKKVECGYAGNTCQHTNGLREQCTDYEVEPWGFSLIEQLVGRDVGFAYSSGEDCR
ncbi:MAG: hypothetical protein JWO36_7141 [Myxococcales bacterium]|nr:hypothetical protein [Myxococcales bacterium]